MTPSKLTINRTPHGQDARHVTAARPSPNDGLNFVITRGADYSPLCKSHSSPRDSRG
jgi:hypothetical protein